MGRMRVNGSFIQVKVNTVAKGRVKQRGQKSCLGIAAFFIDLPLPFL